MADRIKGITIEFKGETRQLSDSLKQVRKESNKLGRKLTDIRKLLKFSPDNVELLDQKAATLNKRVDLTKTKLEELRKAQAQVQAQVKAGDLGADKLDAFNREIIETESKLSTFRTQLYEVNSLGFNNLMESFQNVGEKVGNVGKSLSLHVTAPLIAMGAVSTKSASDFESAFAGVRKTVDASEEDFSKLEGAIRDMSKELPASAEEISGVTENAGQLGIEFKNLIPFTRTMIDLGESTNLTAEEGSVQFARFANIVGMNQDNFDRLGSVIVDLGNNFATTESEIMQMGLRLAGSAEQVGITETQIMGLAAAMSSMGINAEAGGSAMSKTIQTINTVVSSGSDELKTFAKISGMSSEEFAKAWKDKPIEALVAFIGGLGELNESGGDVAGTLKDVKLGGLRVVDTLSRLSGNTEVLNQALQVSDEAWTDNTALAEEAGQRYKTVDSQLQMLRNKFRDIAVTLGDILLPKVMSVADKISELADKFSNLDEGTQNTIVNVGLFAAALGPVLTVVGKITSGLGSVGLAISGLGAKMAGAGSVIATSAGALSGVFAIATAGIAAVIAGIVDLWNNSEGFRESVTNSWETIKESFSGLIEWFSENKERFTVITDSLKKNWRSFTAILGPLLSIAFDVVAKIIKGATGVLTGLFETLTGLINMDWDDAWEGIKHTAQSIAETVTSIVGPFADGIANAFRKLKDALGRLSSQIKTNVVNNWNGLKNDVTSKTNTAVNNVTSKFRNLKETLMSISNTIKTNVSRVWDKVSNAIVSPIRDAKQKVGQIISSIKNLFNFKISWPHIPMPHFSISPSGWRVGDLLKGSIPRLGINWYDQGGIFTSPQVIGVGEKRPEFVGALDDLRYLIRDELGASKNIRNETVNINIDKVNAFDNREVDLLVEKITRSLNRRERGLA